MNECMFRPATREDAGAMLALLRSVAVEGDTLPFTSGIDKALIDT